MTDRVEDGLSVDATLEAAHALCGIATNQDALKCERLDAVSGILKYVDRGHEVPADWLHISADVATFLISVIGDGTDTQDHRFQAAHCLVQGAERGWWRIPTRFL